MMAAPRAAGVEMECDAEAEEGGEGGEPAVDGGGGSGRDFFEKCVGEEDLVVRLGLGMPGSGDVANNDRRP